MIARIWRGWVPQATADDYQRHYESEVSEHLRAVSGFCGARLLRRGESREVMFTGRAWPSDARMDTILASCGAADAVPVLKPSGSLL
jgi:hypothetical protein